jgi:hypothetical protein
MPDDDAEAATTWGLLYPFVVVTSAGGPYDDESFVAGVQLGQLDQVLRTAESLPCAQVTVTVYTALLPQLELAGMARGFPVMISEPVGATAEYPAMPEWSRVVFTRASGE